MISPHESCQAFEVDEERTSGSGVEAECSFDLVYSLSFGCFFRLSILRSLVGYSLFIIALEYKGLPLLNSGLIITQLVMGGPLEITEEGVTIPRKKFMQGKLDWKKNSASSGTEKNHAEPEKKIMKTSELKKKKLNS